MLKKVSQLMVGMSLATLLGVGALSVPVMADNCAKTPTTPLCRAQGGVDNVGGHTGSNGTPLLTRVHNLINLIIYAIGMIAVIMIVLGGIRYTISSGEQSQLKGAKDTIMYAVIGLIVAVVAYAVVGLVVQWL